MKSQIQIKQNPFTLTKENKEKIPFQLICASCSGVTRHFINHSSNTKEKSNNKQKEHKEKKKIWGIVRLWYFVNFLLNGIFLFCLQTHLIFPLCHWFQSLYIFLDFAYSKYINYLIWLLLFIHYEVLITQRISFSSVS